MVAQGGRGLNRRAARRAPRRGAAPGRDALYSSEPGTHAPGYVGWEGAVTVAAFTSDMLIRDALLASDGAAEVFARHGLGCAHCMAAEMETLAAVASMHELSVEALIEDLNALPDRGTEADDV